MCSSDLYSSLTVRLSEQAIFKILGKIWRLSLKRRGFRLSDANDESQVLARLVFAYSSLERTGAKKFWVGKSVARLSERSSGQTRNLRYHNLFLIQKPLFDPPNTQNDLLHWLWVQYTTKHQKQFTTTSSATQFNTYDQIIMFLNLVSKLSFSIQFS